MTFRPSVAKIRLLCVLAGIVCAIFVSAPIEQNPSRIEADIVPNQKFYERANDLCGEGCKEVGCTGECAEEEEGDDCCATPGHVKPSCLYCGP